MSSPCQKCGFDLSGVAPTASGVTCPSCGAVQGRAMPAPPPRRGPPAPPAAPPRRPPPLPGQGLPSPAEELNPFAEPEAARPAQPAPQPAPRARSAGGPIIGVPGPAPEPSSVPEQNPFFDVPPAPAAAEPAANPFLAEPEPAPGPAPAPAAMEQAPVVAPLRVQPGVVAPQIKDPHAEFRRGSWKKPVVLGGIAAVALVGLFFLIPEASEEKATTTDVTAESGTVIGRSVAPEVIQDPNNPTLGASAAAETAPTTRAPEEPVASPDRPDQSAQFADSFKASAK